MDVTADTAGLRGDGAALSEVGHCAGQAPQCDPAAADPVSVSVAAALTQWSQSLWTLMGHAASLREAGGAALTATAEYLSEVDQANATHIANAPDAAGAHPGPVMPAAPAAAPGLAEVPVPKLTAIPAIPAPPPLTGEQIAALLHSGPGTAGLRAFAEHWRATVGPRILNTADAVRRHGSTIAQHWEDGAEQASVRVIEHANWLESSLHPSVVALANAADEAAGHIDAAIQGTPTPEEFADTRTRLRAALADYRASGGRHIGPVIAFSNQLSQRQGTAIAGYTTYAAAAPVATGGAPPEPAPPIVTGSDQGAAVNHRIDDQRTAQQEGGRGASDRQGHGSDGDTLQPSTADGGPVGPAGMPPAGPSEPGLAPPANAVPALMGPGPGVVSQFVSTVPAMAGAAGGGSSSPLSSLAGLSSIPGLGSMPHMGSPSAPPGLGDGNGDPAGELGEPPDFGSDGTMPASGGADGAGEPMATSSAPAVSGAPAGSPGPAVGMGAQASGVPTAATTAAGGPGGPGMFAPPMMGGMGGRDDPDRKSDDRRRVVLRPIANTEAVFGEVERKRPARRAARTTDEGDQPR
ncbi:hypothetical protein [Mycobacterium sp. TY815]|uniref:hypothetical protein n=1 Tax=Mycobacterium sp. TY815 TaxID=3050581 RepID=UPI002742810A|nr:hypothetical protein [Mycobacterium sp. TY815]MDP7707397.1 hypothetical protein [Mycobacterium sp. TY815]